MWRLDLRLTLILSLVVGVESQILLIAFVRVSVLSCSPTGFRPSILQFFCSVRGAVIYLASCETFVSFLACSYRT